MNKAVTTLQSLLISKHNDYGNDNLLIFGEVGIIIRVNDKINRIENLFTKDSSVNESIKDTLLDIAGYSVQAIMILYGNSDKWFTELHGVLSELDEKCKRYGAKSQIEVLRRIKNDFSDLLAIAQHQIYQHSSLGKCISRILKDTFSDKNENTKIKVESWYHMASLALLGYKMMEE